MQRWGLVITSVYALVLILLLLPAPALLLQLDVDYGEILGALFTPESLEDGVTAAWIWILILALIAAEAALLFVTVDVTHGRLRPRRHVAISVTATTIAAGLLCFLIVVDLALAIAGDDIPGPDWFWVGLPVCLWLGWGLVFYLYREGVSAHLDRALGWLFNGSVLALLIAVPTHILVRQRNDCSAPFLSAYGIATGIALMLLAFGPSVIFLYQRKLGEYDRAPALPLLARWPFRTLAGSIAAGALALFLFLPASAGPTATGVVAVEASSVNQRLDEWRAFASEHGMALSPRTLGLQPINPPHPVGQPRPGWTLTCDTRVVADVAVPPIDDTERNLWTYRLYADQFASRDDYARFAESMRAMNGELDSYETADRPALARMVAYLRAGFWLKPGCRYGDSQ